MKPSDVLKNDWNTIERASPEVQVALDACEAGKPDAHKLLVGVPCSICYVNDRYAAVIVRVTPSLQTIEVAHTIVSDEGSTWLDPNRSWANGYHRDIPEPSAVYSYSELDRKTFRFSAKHGEYRAPNRGPRLWIGIAETYHCREI